MLNVHSGDEAPLKMQWGFFSPRFTYPDSSSMDAFPVSALIHIHAFGHIHSWELLSVVTVSHF